MAFNVSSVDEPTLHSELSLKQDVAKRVSCYTDVYASVIQTRCHNPAIHQTASRQVV